MEADFFKVLTTLAVFLFGTVWAYRNIRAINDWFVDKIGIGITSEERKLRRTMDDGTNLVINTSNTEGANTDGQ